MTHRPASARTATTFGKRGVPSAPQATARPARRSATTAAPAIDGTPAALEPTRAERAAWAGIARPSVREDMAASLYRSELDAMRNTGRAAVLQVVACVGMGAAVVAVLAYAFAGPVLDALQVIPDLSI